MRTEQDPQRGCLTGQGSGSVRTELGESGHLLRRPHFPFCEMGGNFCSMMILILLIKIPLLITAAVTGRSHLECTICQTQHTET